MGSPHLLELLEALRVVGLHPAELVSSAIEGGLGDLEVATDLLDDLSLGEELVGFGGLPNHLLGAYLRRFIAWSSCPMVGLGLAQRVNDFTGIRS